MLWVLSALISAEPAPPVLEWPDPGSEEPGGAKLFERDEARGDGEDAGLELEDSAHIGETVYRWEWYGWRNIIGDAAAAVMVIAGIIAWSPIVAGIGGGLYVVGSPIAHLTKGNWGRALIMAGVRIGAPALLALLGGFLFNEIDGGGGEAIVVGVVLGGVIGTSVAVGADVGFFARDKVEVVPKTEIVGGEISGGSRFALSFSF